MSEELSLIGVSTVEKSGGGRTNDEDISDVGSDVVSMVDAERQSSVSVSVGWVQVLNF